MDIDTGNGFIVWSGKDRYIFGTWNGNFNIAFRPEGNKGKPIFGVSLNRVKFTMFKSEFKKLIAAPPESKRPIVFSKYMPDDKKYVTEFVITFVKDDSMIYHMDLSYKENNSERNDRCTFMAPSGISAGSDQMTKADKSALSAQAFLDWMSDEVPIMMALSREKWAPGGKDTKKDTGGGDYFG